MVFSTDSKTYMNCTVDFCCCCARGVLVEVSTGSQAPVEICWVSTQTHTHEVSAMGFRYTHGQIIVESAGILHIAFLQGHRYAI